MELTFKLKIKDQEIELTKEDLIELMKELQSLFTTVIIPPGPINRTTTI